MAIYFIPCIGNYCKQRSYKTTEFEIRQDFEAHEYPEMTDNIMCCYSLQFCLSGNKSQVFNICEVVIMVIDTTWVVSVPGCVMTVVVATQGNVGLITKGNGEELFHLPHTQAINNPDKDPVSSKYPLYIGVPTSQAELRKLLG